jgi:D-alanine--poly(phosphoribitol) ligase subunit 1
MKPDRVPMKINVVEYILETSLKDRGRAAIETVDGQITYETLVRKSYALKNAIGTRFPAKGRPVVVLMQKSPCALAAILAVTMSGNIYCPVDVNAPVERIGKILDSLGESFILVDEAGLNIVEKLKVEHASVHEVASSMWNAETPPVGLESICEEVRCGIKDVLDLDPCYIIFTSGSTGVPKGVTISHRGVLDYIDWANSVYDVGPNDKIGSQAPLFFDNSTLDIYLCWSNGASFHIIPEKTFAFPKSVVDHLVRYDISTIFWVPSVLVNVANMTLLDDVQLPRLRNVLFAGEVMPARPLKYWMERHPGAVYSNLYGPTEITVDCTYFNVPTDWDEDEVPIGVPCRNSGILVLDESDGLADEGELCVRGSGVALGYWNDADKTRAAFVQNPVNKNYNEVIYRTGDLVKRKNGLLYFVGRKDQQIKHNGYRIELGEIESAVAGLERVGECVAGYDQQRKRIYLAVVAGGIERVELMLLLAKLLPKYMIPGKIEFFHELPLTPNRKLDRKAIHEIICR